MNPETESSGYEPASDHLAHPSRREALKALAGGLAASGELAAAIKHAGAPETGLVEYIRQNRRPIEYEKIFQEKSPIVFLGFRADIAADRRELVENLPRFGATHLALAELPESVQAGAEKYVAGELDWNGFLEAMPAGEGYAALARRFEQVLDAAREEKIKILCLDMPKRVQERNNGRLRSANQASIVLRVMEADPKARILVCDDRAELADKPDRPSAPAVIAEQAGARLKPTVVSFAGVRKASEQHPTLEDDIAKAASELGFEHEKFFIAVSRQKQKDSHIVVHLPQEAENA